MEVVLQEWTEEVTAETIAEDPSAKTMNRLVLYGQRMQDPRRRVLPNRPEK